MGNKQVTKTNLISQNQIRMTFMQCKHSLNLKRDKLKPAYDKGEKQFLNIIQNQYRNRDQQMRIVKCLMRLTKQAQAYSILSNYAQNLGPHTKFICQNFNNLTNLYPFLPKIYSLLYAAKNLDNQSLRKLQGIMKQFNHFSNISTDGIIEYYVDGHIKESLSNEEVSFAEINQFLGNLCQKNHIAFSKFDKSAYQVRKVKVPKQLNSNPQIHIKVQPYKHPLNCQRPKNNIEGFGKPQKKQQQKIAQCKQMEQYNGYPDLDIQPEDGLLKNRQGQLFTCLCQIIKKGC